MPKPVSPDNATEVVANPEHDRRLRRTFSAEDKRRILAKAEACSERGQLSALLRRERLYSSQLATWRAQFEREGQSGLEGKTPGRKPLKDGKDRRIEQLEAEKAKLERKLLIAEKLIELQKKKHRNCWPRRSWQTSHARADCCT
jgi:transposase-like protein